MRLHEHAVDLFEIDDAGLVAHRFDEGAEAEILGAAQEAFAGAHDERERVGSEGVVAEPRAVEFGEVLPIFLPS